MSRCQGSTNEKQINPERIFNEAVLEAVEYVFRSGMWQEQHGKPTNGTMLAISHRLYEQKALFKAYGMIFKGEICS
jgi:hypothetical protein